MAKKSIHLIKDVEFVVCPYCENNENNRFKLLHWKHLSKRHNKILKDVRDEYPDIPTMTQTEYDKRIKVTDLGRIKSMQTMNELKTVKCFYCENTKQFPKNFPNNFVCDKCLSEGKENIDNRTKTEANLKREQTNIEKYGEDYVKKFHDKSMKTQNERYDGKIGFANKEVNNKIKEACLEKYGNECYMKTDEAMKDYIPPSLRGNVREKISIALKGKESKLKGKSYIDIHGYDKAMEIIEKKRNKLVNYFIPDLEKILNYMDLELIDDEYLSAHTKHNWRCKICNTEFNQLWNKIQQGYLCPTCYPRNQGYSKDEKELAEFIKSLGLDISEGDRTILNTKELDIYIPDKSVAIEYNGLYWHSELNRENNYHLNKTLECEKKNIQLIHIFEDEWIYKKDLVKNKLKNILNIYDNIININDCEIKEINNKDRDIFLKEYNFLDYNIENDTINLGLFNNNELIILMTFYNIKNNEYYLNIIDKYHNFNLIDYLLNHFKENYNWSKIITYCDRRWYDDKLFNKLNFKFKSFIEPVSYNIIGLHRLINLNSSDDNLNYNKIWDCGHYEFIMENK